MNTTLRRAAAWTARSVLTVAITYFLFSSLHLSWSELTAVDLDRWQPRLPQLLGSIALLLAVFSFMVWLWARMVRALGGPTLSLGESIQIFFVANLGRYIPGKVWQLAGLAYLAGKRGVAVPVASAAAVLGQLCSLGAAALVAAGALWLVGSSVLAEDLAPYALALAGLIGLVVALPPVLRASLRLGFRLGRRGGEAPELDPWFGARWLGLYVPGWIGYGVAFGLLWSAFPDTPPVAWKLAIGSFAAAYFLGYAAVFAPAGVGVREGVLAAALAPSLGVASATVLAIIARIWMTLTELLPLAWIGAWRLVERSRTETETTGNGS